MRFVCDSCRAQYMISDDKVGAKGVKVRCKKCGYVILVRRADGETTQVAPIPTGPGGMSLRDSDATGPNALPPEPGTRPGGDAAANGVHANGHANGSAESPAVTSFGGNGSNGVLGGLEDDEIGAVFDQVLKTGPQKKEAKETSEDVPLGNFDENDDLSSTRVVSADALRKLAQQSEQFAKSGGSSPTPDEPEGNGAAPEAEGDQRPDVPETDWFVAVDDSQQGPITLEKLKDLWDRGEVGPDSLCWRSGYSDWTAIAEVADLKQVLAPKPQKPVIAASPALVGPASGAVVNVPVETSFNIGGMAQSVRTEMPVSMAAAPEGEAPAADTGSWQPSAASALASLVKEEMSVLSRPAARSLLETGPGEISPSRSGSLLDLPSGASNGSAAPAGNGHAANGLLDVPAPSAAGSGAAMPAAAPAAPGFAASPYPAYAPPAPHGVSRTLVIALGVVAVLLVATIGTVLFVFLKGPAQPGAASSAQVAKLDMPPAPAGTKLVTPPAPVAAAPAPAPTTPGAAAPATAGTPPAPAPAPAPAVATPAPAPGPTPAPVPATGARHFRTGSSGSSAALPTKPGDEGGDVITPSNKPPKGGPAGKGGDDEDAQFNSLFGGGGKSGGKTGGGEEAPATGTGGKKPKTVYIPGETGGGGDVKESLSTSDVTQTVLNYKPKIIECVQAQKAKQPGMSGKLVMKWNILPSGKTAGVTVQSEDLKSTYLANCITILVKGMQFPKHKVQGEPIVFPFTF